MRQLAASVLVTAVLSLPLAAGAGEEITYSAGDTALEGYLARPDGDAKRPGVLVVHEWWGNNDYPRKRADMLAELGYVALALDMYGEGQVADHPRDAGRLAGEVRQNMDVGEQRFRAALELLASQPDVDPDRIAAIGYCFGGSVVLEMARRGLPLAAVASFHGSLGGLSPVQPGAVKARVLVLNGADDGFIKPEQIEQFKAEMNAAGADYRFVNYPGAMHGFSNPDATESGKKFGIALAYHPEVDARSWEEMQALFDQTLK
jgi:dienelactone hydrolase